MLEKRHHEEQKLIARNVVAELAPIWQILDFRDLKGTTASWLKAARPIVEKGYLTSQYVAAEFVNNYRRDQIPEADLLEVSVPNPLGVFGKPMIPSRDVSVRIMVSLKVTGPVWMAHHNVPDMTADQIDQVLRDGFSKMSGAATRITLNGGRGMVRTMVENDPLALGVVGIADQGACKSCQFLTTPIMKSAGAKKMDAVAVGHDFCTCSAKPVY